MSRKPRVQRTPEEKWRRKDWGKVEAPHPNHVWQSDMTKVWAGPSVGWAYLVSVIDCCTREIVGWDLSLRCRTEEALAALNSRCAGGFAFRFSWNGVDFDN
jgi:transposase InsO family protein